MPLAVPSKKGRKLKITLWHPRQHKKKCAKQHDFFTTSRFWDFFLSWRPKKKGTPPTLGGQNGDPHPASSKASVERWSWAFFFHQGCYKSKSTTSSSHRRPYISSSFHHFKIWTKHLIEKCKAYRKTMQKRKYVGLLEYWRKTHEKTSSGFFFVWPPVLRVLRKLHSTDFARFSIPGAGFAMRAMAKPWWNHGETILCPMAFLVPAWMPGRLPQS